MKIGITNSEDYAGKARIEYGVNWIESNHGSEQYKYFGEDKAAAEQFFKDQTEVEYDVRLTVSLISNDEDNDVIDEEILDSFYDENLN